MQNILLFLSGMLFANSIPHFINGIGATTREYHNPFFYKLFPHIPAPVFNVIYGMLNFILAVLILPAKQNLVAGLNRESYIIAAGFAFSAIGLSMLFHKRRHEQ